MTISTRPAMMTGFSKTAHTFALPSTQIGEIVLLGRYGAYFQYYRVVSIDRDRAEALLEAVSPRSQPNDDGTFSTVYEVCNG